LTEQKKRQNATKQRQNAIHESSKHSIFTLMGQNTLVADRSSFLSERSILDAVAVKFEVVASGNIST
jgi:hypothetical protein